MRIRKKIEEGFTLLEIMIVVTLVGLLATIATPTWVRARTNSQISTCVNNLRQIDGAKQQWGLDYKRSMNDTPAYTDISVYLKHSVVCPSGGSAATFANTYTMNVLSVRPVCQIVPDTHVIPETTD